MKVVQRQFFRSGNHRWCGAAAVALCLALGASSRAPGQTAASSGQVVVQAPAPASQIKPSSLVVSSHANKHLPKWLQVSGEYRVRSEEHTAYSFTPAANDAYALSRARLNLDLTPTSWFHAYVQAQDSEALGIDRTHATGSYKDVFDLRQAYADFRNGEKGWIRLRVGRQEMQFGAQRMVGISDWSNTARVFDGMRLTLGHEGGRIDVFTSSVVVNHPTSFDDHQGGMSFHGAYGSFAHFVPNATFEPFAFWKTASSVKSLEGKLGNESEFTFGLRTAGKLPRGFDYAVEGARQAGHYSKDTIFAYAGYGIVGYSPSYLPLKPRFAAEYGYATGADANSAGRMETYDPLYPTTHGIFGITDLFGWRNLRHLRTSAEIKPFRRLGLNFDYHTMQLASRYDGVYNTSGSAIVKAPEGGALSKDVGQEADGYFKYELRSNINFGGGFGHLFAGQFLKQNSRGSDASYPYFFVSYKF
jgi:hypothetical protein